ncbi:hypothetical protein [Paraburkholderia kururiensis]|uniref:hypothetical protein n=1 Tax=Paraburkholderia kururiensis TaxID=984307 RepID=UPI00144AD695|nr:hypothetical protein [Paraburkholderia kururiensis]
MRNLFIFFSLDGLDRNLRPGSSFEYRFLVMVRPAGTVKQRQVVFSGSIVFAGKAERLGGTGNGRVAARVDTRWSFRIWLRKISVPEAPHKTFPATEKACMPAFGEDRA